MTPVYLRLHHGRTDPAAVMDDWGTEGPTLGPLAFVQVTYLADVKLTMEREAFRAAFPEQAAEWEARGVSNGAGYDRGDGSGFLWVDHHLKTTSDLILYRGVYYGDWSVVGDPA